MKILRSLNPNEILIENCLDEEINITDADEDGNVINRNFDLYQGKTVIFRNCPKVKVINAECLQLQGLKFENCPNLEELSAYHNKLTKLDLRQCPNLKIVNVPYNQLNSVELSEQTELEILNVRNNNLTALDLSNNSKIKTLICSYNKIRSLIVNHLDNLKRIECENNSLKKLKLNDLKNLEHVQCFNNRSFSKMGNFWLLNEGITDLDITNCSALKFLDCGENNLEKLFLKNCPCLETVSCKSNSIKGILIKSCQNLGYLDFSKQFSFIKNKWTPRSIIKGKISTVFFIDKESCQSLEKVKLSEGTKTCFIEGKQSIPFNPQEDFKYFPKLTDFGVSNIEDDPDFEAWTDKKIKEQELREISGNDSGYSSESEDPKKKKNDEEPIINDPSLLTNNYKGLLKKFGNEPEITITGNILTKTLIIDGYQGRKINVGNNPLLRYLVVKNCPHLTTLRYAHCGLRHEAWYDPKQFNNPNLTIIDNHNWDGGIAWGNPEEDNQAAQEQFKQELASQPSESDQQIQIIAQIIKLLAEAEAALNKQDYSQLARLIKQIKELVSQVTDAATVTRINAKINQLEARLQSSQIVAESVPVKSIVGLIGVSCLVIGLMFLLIKKVIFKKKSNC